MSQSSRRLRDVQEAFDMTPQPLEKSQKTLGFAFLSAEAKEEQAKKQQDEHTRLNQQKKQLEEDCKSLAQSWGLSWPPPAPENFVLREARRKF